MAASNSPRLDSRDNQISKDGQGFSNPIPLSPQWLQTKPGENKTGLSTGENQFSSHSGHFGRLAHVMKSPGHGEGVHDVQKRKNVFRPSVLDAESGCRDRWRDEERETNTSVRRDRWREGDKELVDQRKVDRWTNNMSVRQLGEVRRAPPERWTDSSNKDSNHDQRRDTKWNTRWEPDHKENDSSREKWLDQCKDATNDAKPKYLDAGSVIFKVKEFYIKAAAEEPLPTNPAPDASWMGSFILKDEETSISVQAHPTSQGLSKVKMLCKEMPKVLEFELFSYKDFLRTVFKGCDPDDQDIGLYFFPDNRIRPEAYISHLEQLSGNYFLRSCIDGVELLVFTSKVLHKDYRKRNKCDFLWGIYRRRHRKLKGAAEETMVADMDIDAEDVDMEVDMLGGEIVGPVDVIVPKQSVESNINIPPGFSTSMRGQWNNSPQNFEHVASGKQDDVPRGFTALMKIKEEVQ